MEVGMGSIRDTHSTATPDNNAALLWIVFGLIGVVATFVGIIALVPKGL
jgi:hypothetical protein